MKKILFVGLIISLLASCSPTKISEQSSFSVQDALGREVQFSKFPERIVIAGKQTPTIANFYYLFPSRIDRLLAIENRSQSPDKFLDLIDDSYKSKLLIEKGAGVEQIAPLEPDLVILKTTMKDKIGVGLEEVGIPVVYVSLEDVEAIYSDIRVLGTILDSQARSEEIILKYQRDFAEISDQIQTDYQGNNVLLMQAKNSESGFSFKVPAENWLQTIMVEMLHQKPVWKSPSLSGGWSEVNIEQILSWSPAYVMVINYQGKSSAITDDLYANPVWQQYIAEKGTSLYAFPYDYSSWDQPDTRWILGYTWMASKFFPSIISKDEMIEKVKDFYTFFYGLDESYIDDEIIPNISPYL